MNKKLLLTIVVGILAIFINVLPVAAQDYIIDRIPTLDSSQISILEMKCEELAEADIGITICIEEELSDDEFGDDSFRLRELASTSGYRNGIVYLVDHSRSVSYFYPFGKMTENFDDDISYQINAIANDKLKNEGCFEACKSVIANVDSIISGDGELYDGLVYMPAISDKAGFLSDSQREELKQKIDKIRNKYEVDVAVYTDYYLEADSAEFAAEGIYDRNFYGIGEERSGILFYISKSPREYYVTFYPTYMEQFSGNSIKYIEDKIAPYMEENNYSEAISAYASAVDNLLSGKVDGTDYTGEENEGGLSVVVWIAMAVAAVGIIAFVYKRYIGQLLKNNRGKNGN